MHPILSIVLRFIAGLAILAVGLFVMNSLIAMKTEMAISDRPVPARPVRTVQSTLGELVPNTPVEGRVEAMNRLDLFTEVNGVLTLGGKEFREGTSFKKGEVILRLDDSEPKAALVSQRSQFLQTVSVSLADLQVDFPEDWSDWEQFAQSIEVDQSLPELPEIDSQREKLFTANRGILSGYYAIRSTEERLSKYEVTAPFDGIVSSTSVRPGSLVRAGQPVGSFVGMKDFEIKTAVHARFLPTIRKGDRVEFHGEDGEAVARGTVARISPNVDIQSQSATVYCSVRQASGENASLRDGRYLSGQIKSAPFPEVSRVNNEWIQADQTVFLVVGDELKRQPVEVVFGSRTTSIVRGLEPGSLLLAEVLSSAYDGMKVAAIEEIGAN
jgi:membrane fusion protein (multidrug efflux system)